MHFDLRNLVVVHAGLVALVVFCLAPPRSAFAEPVTKAFRFTASNLFSPFSSTAVAPQDPVSGSFIVSYDTDADIVSGTVDAIELTILGFSYSRNGVSFDYNSQFDRLHIYGSLNGPVAAGKTNDFLMSLRPATTAPPVDFASFGYTDPSIGDDLVTFHADTRQPPSNVVISSEDPAPAIVCEGFLPPLNDGAIQVPERRIIPIKALFFDENGFQLTDTDLMHAPVIEVTRISSVASDAEEVDMAQGRGFDGNEMRYSDEHWIYNLGTSSFSAPGTYMIEVMSGDAYEYRIVSTCIGQFVI